MSSATTLDTVTYIAWLQGRARFQLPIPIASPNKAKRAVAAALRYQTLLIDQILDVFPPGTTPPIEDVTLFKDSEIGGYLLEPDDPGYLNPYRLWPPFT